MKDTSANLQNVPSECGDRIRMIPLPPPGAPGERVVVPLWKALEIANGRPRRTGTNARALRELGEQRRMEQSLRQEGAGSAPHDKDQSEKAAPAVEDSSEDMPVWIRCGACGHSEKRTLFEAGKRCPECGGCVSITFNPSHKPLFRSKSQIQRFWRQGERDVSIVPERDANGELNPKKYPARGENDRQLSEKGGAQG